MTRDEPNAGACTPTRPGARFLAGLVAFDLACLASATYPAALYVSRRLRGCSTVDSLQHLWTMRWNSSCLPAGLQEMTTGSDGEERPVHRVERGDDRPYGLRVNAIKRRAATREEAREFEPACGGVERR